MNVLNMNVSNGYNLHLTIDHRLQELASNKLGNNHGAVVAMNPQTARYLQWSVNLILILTTKVYLKTGRLIPKMRIHPSAPRN